MYLTGLSVSLRISARTAAEEAGVPFESKTSTPSSERMAIELPSSPTSPYGFDTNR